MLKTLWKNLFNYNEAIILQLHITVAIIFCVSTLGLLSLEIQSLKGTTLVERVLEVPYLSGVAAFGLLIIFGVLTHCIKESINNYRNPESS